MRASTRYFRATSFAVLTVTLVGLIAILVVLLLLVLDVAEEAQAPQKRSLLMIAYNKFNTKRSCSVFEHIYSLRKATFRYQKFIRSFTDHFAGPGVEQHDHRFSCCCGFIKERSVCNFQSC